MFNTVAYCFIIIKICQKVSRHVHVRWVHRVGGGGGRVRLIPCTMMIKFGAENVQKKNE